MCKISVNKSIEDVVSWLTRPLAADFRSLLAGIDRNSLVRM